MTWINQLVKESCFVWCTYCFLPSSGWQCTIYWWCCWTSPVPLEDSSCEIGDCCSKKKKKTPTVTTHSPMFAINCMFAFNVPSQYKQGSSPVYISCQMHSWPKYNNLFYAGFSFQIQDDILFSFLFLPFFYFNEVDHWSWPTDRVEL